MELQGSRWLITGAAGALGRSLAVKAAGKGASLVLLDKNQAGLEQVDDAIQAAGYEAPLLLPLDLAALTPDITVPIVSAIEEQLGGLDGLCHCAAHLDGLQPMQQVAPEDWLRSIQVNVNAPWLLTVMLLPLLRESSNGRLLFTLDEPRHCSGAFWGSYGTSKAALAGHYRQWAAELAESTCKVAGVQPGPFRSALRSKVYLSESPAKQRDPDEVAAALLSRLENDDWSSGEEIHLAEA